MQNIRLVCLDIDGTLLNFDRKISIENQQAILRAKEMGVQMSFVTGRIWPTPLRYIRQLGLFHAPVVTANGAAIYLTDGTLLQQHVLPNDKVKAILEIARHYHASAFFFTQQGLYVSNVDDELREYRRVRKTYKKDERAKIRMLSRLEREEEMFLSGVHKVSMNIASPVLLDKIREEIDTLADVETAKAWHDNLGINPVGIHKGTGLRFLSEYYGIPLDMTLAMGDQENDIPMIEMAGMGIAVGNACEELKLHADAVIGSCNDSAVAEALTRFVF